MYSNHINNLPREILSHIFSFCWPISDKTRNNSTEEIKDIKKLTTVGVREYGSGKIVYCYISSICKYWENVLRDNNSVIWMLQKLYLPNNVYSKNKALYLIKNLEIKDENNNKSTTPPNIPTILVDGIPFELSRKPKNTKYTAIIHTLISHFLSQYFFVNNKPTIYYNIMINNHEHILNLLKIIVGAKSEFFENISIAFHMLKKIGETEAQLGYATSPTYTFSLKSLSQLADKIEYCSHSKLVFLSFLHYDNTEAATIPNINDLSKFHDEYINLVKHLMNHNKIRRQRKMVKIGLASNVYRRIYTFYGYHSSIDDLIHFYELEGYLMNKLDTKTIIDAKIITKIQNLLRRFLVHKELFPSAAIQSYIRFFLENAPKDEASNIKLLMTSVGV